MKGTYTFFIASSPGKLRKLTIPVYVLHGVAVLAIIGSILQFTFLQKNASAVAVASGGLRLMPTMSFADSSYTPSIWPVMGHITDAFGARLDPFSGEGAFHTGVDIASDYGAPVHVAAD